MWIEMYTKAIDLKNSKIKDHFFPSLIQEKIDSEFEIRSVYLDGNFYSLAIFTTYKNTDDIDLRKNISSFRYKNFKLPKELENKLEKLILQMNLQICTIDLLYSKTKKFIFLEINPQGQFGYVSINGNYYIEKILANYLIKKINKT